MVDEFVNTLVAEEGEVYEEVVVRPVPVPPTRDWNINELANRAKGASVKETRANLAELFRQIPRNEFAALRHKWKFWARPNQIAPSGFWTFWLLLAGRGFGKTRTGAEWINERVQLGLSKRIALVAPTAADVRKVMVEGESGLLAIAPPWNRPLFEPSKLQLTWPNGAIAQLFSAEEPERLRGPQCDTFWADELAAWKKLQETWDMLQFGFRLGNDLRGCITTTPKPLPLIKELIEDNRDIPEEKRTDKWSGETVITKGSTYDNKANLAPKFFTKVVTQYEGTRLGRQELEADILEDMPGALWARTNIEANRISGIMSFPPIVKEKSVVPGADENDVFEDPVVLSRAAQRILDAIPEDLVRTTVNVDPNTSNNEGSDEIGITVTAKGVSGRGYVLADCSIRGSPHEWASVAVMACDAFKGDRIIGEANQGGNMVETTIMTAAKSLKTIGKRSSDFIGVTLVHATKGKVVRAEPVSALYEQNRITHVGTHKTLEDQMCLFTQDFDRKAMGYSPDRVDSLVWGFFSLFLENQDGEGLFDFIRMQAAEKAANAAHAQTTEDSREGWVKMKALPGSSSVYGKEGDRYCVVSGHILVKPEDVPGLRLGGLVEV